MKRVSVKFLKSLTETRHMPRAVALRKRGVWRSCFAPWLRILTSLKIDSGRQGRWRPLLFKGAYAETVAATPDEARCALRKRKVES